MKASRISRSIRSAAAASPKKVLLALMHLRAHSTPVVVAAPAVVAAVVLPLEPQPALLALVADVAAAEVVHPEELLAALPQLLLSSNRQKVERRGTADFLLSLFFGCQDSGPTFWLQL